MFRPSCCCEDYRKLLNVPTGTTGWAPGRKPLLLAGGVVYAVRISGCCGGSALAVFTAGAAAGAAVRTTGSAGFASRFGAGATCALCTGAGVAVRTGALRFVILARGARGSLIFIRRRGVSFVFRAAEPAADQAGNRGRLLFGCRGFFRLCLRRGPRHWHARHGGRFARFRRSSSLG